MQRALLNLVSQIPTTIREYQKQKASECCSDILRLFYSSDSVQSCPSSTTRLPHSLTGRTSHSTPHHPFRSSLLYTPHLPAFLRSTSSLMLPLPSLHGRFPDPLLSLRLFIPLSSPRSASSIHSAPSISADTFNQTRQHSVSVLSKPEYRRTTTFKSLKKNKKRRGEGGESKPTGQNAHNVAPVSRLFNISERWLFENPLYCFSPAILSLRPMHTVARLSSAPPGVCEKGRTIAGFCEQASPGPSWPWRSLPPHRLWRSPSERRPTRPRLQ